MPLQEPSFALGDSIRLVLKFRRSGSRVFFMFLLSAGRSSKNQHKILPSLLWSLLYIRDPFVDVRILRSLAAYLYYSRAVVQSSKAKAKLLDPKP